MKAPVGKSGPFTCSISPSVEIAGSSMYARHAASAIDEQVGKARGKNLRLTLRSVVVGLEVDSILVDVGEQEVRDLAEPRFRVAHGRRRIRIHRPEIALTVDQRNAQRPRLHHAREGVVDRAVAVRVILTHDVTDNASRLAIRTT